MKLNFFAATKYIELIPLERSPYSRAKLTRAILVKGFPRHKSAAPFQKADHWKQYEGSKAYVADVLLAECQKVDFMNRHRTISLEIDGKLILVTAHLHSQKKPPDC
jgi:hypothetical protein